MRPMWACPACGRSFANQNQSHACGPLGDLDAHFAGCTHEVRAAFDRIVGVARGLGPVRVLPQKTRIALQARMSFAAFQPRRLWLGGHLVLARRVESPRFHRIEHYSARNVVHMFRLASPDDVDEEFAAWVAEAYQVGLQEHIRPAHRG
jgi:Domain of unknown function (DUF5655)